jgi:hypothetical protein
LACQISISALRTGRPSEPSTATDDDALAERLAVVLLGEVAVACAHVVGAERGAGQLREPLRQQQQRLARRAQPGADVRGTEIRRVRVAGRALVVVDAHQLLGT